MSDTPCVGRLTYGYSIVTPETTDANNVVFPALTSIKRRETPKYSENTHHIRDWENVLEIEAILYDPARVVDVEAYVAMIEQVLKTPGLYLRVNYQGVGINNLIRIDPDYCTRNGPYPQEVLVQPFAGNKAIHIKWTVAWYAPVGCQQLAPNNNQIMDMTHDMTWDISDDGEIDIVLSGKIVFRRTLNNVDFHQTFDKITDAQPFSSIRNYFHSLGYTLDVKKNLGPDKRTINFEIRFAQRKEYNALFPYTSMIEADHTVESSLLGDEGIASTMGFRKWLGSINVNVTLPPRVHKAWALVVFRRIVADRLRLLNLMTGKAKKAANETTPTNTDRLSVGRYIPLRFGMRDSLYSRQASFTFEYIFVSDLDLILSHSNMFTRVNTAYDFNTTDLTYFNDPEDGAGDPRVPANIAQQWYVNRATKRVRNFGTDGTYDYKLDNIGIVRFSPCAFEHTSLDTPSIDWNDSDGTLNPRQTWMNDNDYTHPLGQRRKLDMNDQFTPFNLEAIPAIEGSQNIGDPLAMDISEKNSWIDYKQAFEIAEDTGIVQVAYLQNTPNSYYTGGISTQPETKIASIGYNPYFAHDPPLDMVARRPSRHVITMKGHALRVRYPIPMPAVQSIAGGAAYRIGKPRWRHVQVAQGSKYPVYLAMWEIQYTMNNTLNAGDALVQINNTGSPGVYS